MCRRAAGAVLGLLILIEGGAGAQAGESAGPITFREGIVPLLEKYCSRCHGAKRPRAGLNLAAFADEAAVIRAGRTWRRVLAAVRDHEMPPEDRPQPTAEEADRITHWIEATLSKADCRGPTDPGRVTLRRLNRTEYNNTVRDLVGVDFHPADDFPSDDVGYGFDNIGDVLSLPPILLEKYLAAAEQIAERAIVAEASSAGPSEKWPAEALVDPRGGSAEEGGRLLASTGEVQATFRAPRSGDYRFRVRAYGQQAGPETVKMALKVDGRPIQQVEVAATEPGTGVYEARVQLAEGERGLAAAFLNDYYKPDDPNPNNRDRNLWVEAFEIQGPALTPDAPRPESHRRIIFRRPEGPGDWERCAREVLERFATRAYRRPVRGEELDRLVALVRLAQHDGETFERGIQLAVEAVLVSPHFLFRVELDRGGRRGGQKGPHPINDFELATRLSYFLWSTMPDDELFELARRKALRNEGILEHQVRRMLADRKARALVENFADQWLQVRNLKTISPDTGRFPNWDEELRGAMLEETELFFEAVLREDRSLLDLIDADFTFLNERLARHYGIAGVSGQAFRRVALTDRRRGGIVTQASVLTVTSNPTRTSPVKRGKWILEQVLGTPPPPPPPDVPVLKEDREALRSGSLRQRMEQHRANPSCASCHERMDPLGFGLENFDAIGAWRDRDGEFPIDASGTLPGGVAFRGPAELKAILKAKDRQFVRSFAEKMLTYALGRGLESFDQCAVDRICAALAADGDRFSRLVLEIVLSEPFQNRRGREEESP